jgi:hypothetical protein
MSAILFVFNVFRWVTLIGEVYFYTSVFLIVPTFAATLAFLEYMREQPVRFFEHFAWYTLCWCIGRTIRIAVDIWRVYTAK